MCSGRLVLHGFELSTLELPLELPPALSSIALSANVLDKRSPLPRYRRRIFSRIGTDPPPPLAVPECVLRSRDLLLLDLEGNLLTTLPPTLTALSHLTSLNLNSNRFTIFPNVGTLLLSAIAVICRR